LHGGGFRKVDQAFNPSVERSDAHHVLLRFVNAEGYYHYRHRFQFKVQPAHVSLGQVQLPPGKQHHDEYFGDT
ncbi:protein-disulfide reductase DsbD domain-containing protein, partial [Pseudomonas aeruginosa]|uniref:protein-disulfide reductase DsbD domain-containing protein n=1 Tax=Pseudomonas aeruginosa TaxID=287 RepID=UPI003F818F71